jgi:hypothetical protein
LKSVFIRRVRLILKIVRQTINGGFAETGGVHFQFF